MKFVELIMPSFCSGVQINFVVVVPCSFDDMQVLRLIVENVLATRKGKKLDLTSFKDNVPEHSVDLHAACPRCLAVEASKPGAKDGESCFVV